MAGIDELGILFANDAVEQAEALNVNRLRRQETDPFELSDKKFVKLFRINKRMADELIDSLNPFMTERRRISALCPTEKVSLHLVNMYYIHSKMVFLSQIFGALRFFAAGSYQQDVGQNFNISLSQSSMSRSIHEVVEAIHESNFFENWIRFPDSLEAQSIPRLQNK